MIELIDSIRNAYGIDGRIFLALYVMKVFLFWTVFVFVIRAARAKDWSRFASWCLLDIAIFLTPYTYAYMAGRNLPPWCSWVYGGLVVFAAALLAWKIRIALSRFRPS
jgi:hypothetical protein